MIEYKCLRCGYKGKQKSHLINHLKRKNICPPTNEEISIENIKKMYGFETTPKQHPNSTQTAPKLGNQNSTQQHPKLGKTAPKQHPGVRKIQHICEYCKKIFTRKTGLKKHLQICEASEPDSDKIEEMQKEIDKLKKQLENSNNTTNNNITNNNYNTTNNNNSTNMTVININNFGEENTKYITKDYILALLEKPFQAIPELIKYTHFNKDHPENHNIKITNKKEPFVKVLKNNKWELMDKKDTICDLIDKKHSQLNVIDIKNNVEPHIYSRIELFNQKYINDDKDIVNKLYKDSELILLNNS